MKNTSTSTEFSDGSHQPGKPPSETTGAALSPAESSAPATVSAPHFELVESLPTDTEKRLALHEANLATYIKGFRLGAAQMYGYAFLAGREAILAREALPVSKKNDRGFQKWVEGNFPDVCIRTVRNWMAFSELLSSKTEMVSVLEFGKTKFSKGDCKAILDIVPQLMDGKTMTAFMRDSQLARDPKPNEYHPPTEKPEQSAEDEALNEKLQAEEDFVHIARDLKYYGDHFAVLSDSMIAAQQSFLEAQVKARAKWLNTSKSQRDQYCLDEIAEILK